MKNAFQNKFYNIKDRNKSKNKNNLKLIIYFNKI